ncbi:MAG: cytochrome c [Ferruginibacter sp.]
MKQFLFVFTMPLLLLMSCRDKNISSQHILTGNNLTSSFIYLDADSAYTLKTPKGAIIKIEKNSFAASRKSKLTLEIKEAYTMQDILLAGLSTESNGKLLSSGGMIYLNAKAGDEKVKLLKPIKISIPGKVYEANMQLFKGEIKDDSSINWIGPQPLDTSPVAQKMITGEKLFKANCASCHKPTKEFTGPALALARVRAPDADWPYRFTKDPVSMYQTDPYATAIFKKYNKVMMTAFNSLSREDVTAILDYCDNEALKEGFPSNTQPMPEEDIAVDSTNPCFVNDTVYLRQAGSSITIISNDTMPGQSPANGLGKAEDNEGFRNGFTDQVSSVSEMYEFSIETFGWYNVDMYVEGYAGTTYVTINVQLQMEYKFGIHLYLFCPEKKMLSVANKEDNGIYSFDKVDGKIPLFLNDEAIILAFGTNNDKLFYGTASFKIQGEQTTIIKVKETSKAELRSFIELNKIDGIKIDVNKKEMTYQPDPVIKDTAPVEIDIIKVPCNDYKMDSIRNKK